MKTITQKNKEKTIKMHFTLCPTAVRQQSLRKTFLSHLPDWLVDLQDLLALAKIY
jgi:hypothetical protein